MRKRWLLLGIGVAVVVLAAGGAVLAAYRYEHGRGDRLARGIRIAGVEVGGLPAPLAVARVRARLAARFDRPLALASRTKRFPVRPRALGLRALVAPAVATALARSRGGSFLRRAWRDVRGRRLDLDLPVHVELSRPAVARLVARVSRTLARAPRNGHVEPSASSIRLVPSRAGLAVRRLRLRRAVADALLDPESPRLLAVPVRSVAPRVTTAQLRRRYGTFIGVSRGEFKLRLFKDFRLVKTYGISVGQVGYDTAAGLYRIQTKVVNPNWIVPHEPWAGSLAGQVIPGGSPQNPLKARWMGFHGGSGVHGTDATWSIGHAASHGCIRMTIPDVEDLYDRVSVGTPIYIG